MRKISGGNRLVNITVSIADDMLKLRIPQWAGAISDLRKFWTQYFAVQFFADIQKNFRTEGGLVGGWRALSPAYAAWKRRKYGRLPILVRTGAMRESFTIGGRGNYLRSMKDRADMGSKDPKVPFHNLGTSRMPRRRVVLFSGTKVYRDLLVSYLRSELRSARGAA